MHCLKRSTSQSVRQTNNTWKKKLWRASKVSCCMHTFVQDSYSGYFSYLIYIQRLYVASKVIHFAVRASQPRLEATKAQRLKWSTSPLADLWGRGMTNLNHQTSTRGSFPIIALNILWHSGVISEKKKTIYINVHKHILKKVEHVEFHKWKWCDMSPCCQVFVLDRCWGRRLLIQALLHITWQRSI